MSTAFALCSATRSTCGVMRSCMSEPHSEAGVFRAGESNQRRNFSMQLHAIIAASALAISSATAFAQSPPAGAAADPSTKQNAQPAPSAPNPSDPSAASPPAASPSAPPATTAPGSEGASTGESGSSARLALPLPTPTPSRVSSRHRAPCRRPIHPRATSRTPRPRPLHKQRGRRKSELHAARRSARSPGLLHSKLV